MSYTTLTWILERPVIYKILKVNYIGGGGGVSNEM